MNVRPLGNRILIKKIETETTESGLYLAPSARPDVICGKVIAVGPGKLNVDGSRTLLPIDKGDKVLISRKAGQPLDDSHIFVTDIGILGIIREK